MAPVVRKRGSMKKKKSWRKNIDLKDVDSFLEDQRLEERLGVKYSEQKNEDLFVIDTQGRVESAATDDLPKYKQNVKIGNSMRLVETETPKSFQILVKRSAVPPHIIRKTRIKKSDSKSSVTRTIVKRKLRKEILKAKNELERKGTAKRNEPKQGEFKYDIWSTVNNDRDLGGCSDWLTNDAIRHTLSNTGKLKKQIPKSVHSKTSLLPAIEMPHPGLSYNPSLKDHRDILEKAAESEVKILEEEKHLDRVTAKMFHKIPKDKLEKDWLSEMTVGLYVSKTESDEDEGEDYKAVNLPVKNKKKTLKKRNKAREAKLMKEKLRKQKIEKKKLSDLYKLRKYNEMLDKKEEKILSNIKKRKEIKEKKPYKTKLLSQTKYQEPKIDFNLVEELSGNLRGIKQEGNILYDRYKSLQKRNILPPAIKRQVKKREVKKYERDHTKMGWESKGYIPYEKPVSNK